MSVKYRIRLPNERVIGPFSADEVAELFFKKHITGDELCQQFPIGDWKAISLFPALQNVLKKIKENNLTHTHLDQKDADKPVEQVEDVKQEKTRSEIKTFQEFKFGKNINNDVNYEELEKKYQKEKADGDDDVEKNEDGSDKTRIVNRSVLKKSEDVDKTVVIASKAAIVKKDSIETQKKKEVEKKIKEELSMEQEIIEKEKREKEKELLHQEMVNEKTEFFNLEKILPTINAQLSASEVELDQLAKIEENKEKIRIKELENQLNEIDDDVEFDEDENEEVQENFETNKLSENTKTVKKVKKKRKKGMSLVVALAFLGIFYVLLTPDEKAKTAGPLFFDVKFPITQEYEDSAGATEALKQGRELYAKNTYIYRAQATSKYLISLQKKFGGNDALGEIVLTYAELLDETKDSKLSANTIYKLIQLSENKMLIDLNVVTGTALFYGKIGKYQTGINVIKNYFRAKGAASTKLLAYYLDLLINAEDLPEARKVFAKLKDSPKKPFEAYYYLAKFDDIDNQPADAQAIIEEGLKSYPNSSLLLLKYADYLLKDKAIKKYEEVLLRCKQNNIEGSPTYTAKFFYHMGLLSALKGKNKEAAEFFKQSLNIKESDELRVMLSSLEIGGDKLSQSLILESKVVSLIKKSKVEIKNKNLEAAFSLSIEAIDAAPDNVAAILLHTQLQLRRGLFDSAINTLQIAISNNPTNFTLKKSLVNAYLKSNKLQEAQKTLVDLSQTKYAFGNEYASLMGDFYLESSNIPLSIRWYSEALNRDPLSDRDMFQLAKVFLRIKKFAEAKTRLTKALILDPRNTEYLAMNAEILFEQDNTDTAIGYLRDAISEIGEDAKLLSAIAILYYRSGQPKEFQNYYKRIQQLPKKDEAFYEFLIYASKLEERNDDYITYSRELLKLNPGNLKARLELGEFLYSLKRYPEAIVEFEEIKNKLASYPKIHYMLAKISMAMGDLKKAKEMAQKELELNPGIDFSYFIVGEVAKAEKDYNEAIVKYEKAISLNPKYTDALLAMAWIRLAQNYGSEAVELYTRALKEDKTNPEIVKQLGFAYKAVGQRAMAKEKFEDYLKLSPGAADRDQIELHIKSLQ